MKILSLLLQTGRIWAFTALVTGIMVSGCASPDRKGPTMSESPAHSPLKGTKVMAFAAVHDLDVSRAFYEGKLGLHVVSQDKLALMLNCEGILIRLQKIPDHQAVKYTVLGWEVSDIRATLARVEAAGVKCEHYDFMKFQDKAGVATFPNGDMVAWFKDPDGNVFSLAQFAG